MAKGIHAYGYCDKCGVKVRYTQLVRDSYNTALYVCRICKDEAPTVQPNLNDNPALSHARRDPRTDVANAVPLATALGLDNIFGGGT